MNIFWFIHLLIPIFIILMPLLPNRLLYKVLWFPMIMPILWLIFDKCPLTALTPGYDERNKDTKEFLLPLFKKYIYKDMTHRKCEQLTFVIIGISILLSSYKLLRKCKI